VIVPVRAAGNSRASWSEGVAIATMVLAAPIAQTIHPLLPDAGKAIHALRWGQAGSLIGSDCFTSYDVGIHLQEAS
jgi:hypothetical protein